MTSAKEVVGDVLEEQPCPPLRGGRAKQQPVGDIFGGRARLGAGRRERSGMGVEGGWRIYGLG
jgi:hypothetical protein